MSQIGPTQLLERNGNGSGAAHGQEDPLHGGVPDGLPVAARQQVSAGQTNGNGAAAGRHAAGLGEAHAVGDGSTIVTPENGSGDTPTDIGEETALSSVLESLLFVAGEPVEVSHLAKSLDLAAEVVQQGLAHLADQYKTRSSGLRVQVHNGRYQLVTAPTAARYVEDFLNLDVSTKLSSAALETLAIVAYRQPATRAQIESIRGVDSSGVLRSLVARGLIEETGRLDAVGRPIVYGVTELFMQHFGLTELDELPPLGEEETDLLHATTMLAGEAEEDGHAALNGDTPADGREDFGVDERSDFLGRTSPV